MGGFGRRAPQREATKLADGSWLVVVTPPAWSGFSISKMVLSNEQYCRYRQWLDNRALPLARLLPELGAGQRETLMSGINEAEWDRAFGSK